MTEKKNRLFELITLVAYLDQKKLEKPLRNFIPVK